MKTRVGKIARLPKEIREKLNVRLENGQMGPEVLAWLNQLPEVRTVLSQFFGGQDVTKQNLSEWRHGGYEDWMSSREGRVRLREMVDEALSLRQTEGGADLSGSLATIMLVEVGQTLDRLHEVKDPGERWNRLRTMCLELSRLRADSSREKRLHLRNLIARSKSTAGQGQSR
jgi:hypothetical protein